MKTFKNYLTELSHPAQTDSEPVGNNWDALDPGTDESFEQLNAYVVSIGAREYVNPKGAIMNLKTKLSRLGYEFNMTDYNSMEDGTVSFPLTKGGGTFEVNRDGNPYGEFVEGDGISDKAGTNWSIMITTSPSDAGKTYVEAEIVRNTED